jgi:ABC-2 type transport system ATP-binding protein
MQQKIQFIATLLHEPELIIMDEPFSGLDPVNAALMQETLIALRKEGKAILFSTHRMDQVEKMCDAICVISGGKQILAGSMREVKSRYPNNRVVMDFEGSDAFLQHPSVAEATHHNGHAEIRLKDGDDAQALLAEAVKVAKIRRFEVSEPTLEQIFIEAVGGEGQGGGLLNA